MGTLIGAIILVAIILIGFVLPKTYNDNFSHKYKQGILNMGLSLLCAVTILFFWGMVDHKEVILIVVSFLLMIGSVTYTVITIFTKSKRLTGSTRSALLSVVMQFISVAGVAIVIALIITMIVNGGKKKKKR